MVGLCIHHVPHWLVIARVYQIFHLKRQPTAITCGVAQKLYVIAGAAERRYVIPMLVIVGVGCTLIDGLHRNGRLQLVELCRAHGIELLTTYEGILSQRNQVVARHAAGIALRIEIVAQFGWKQMLEPGGLIRTLFAYQYQYLVVHHIVINPSCHHGYQPSAQTHLKEFLFLLSAFDGDTHCQNLNSRAAVPWLQTQQVTGKRIKGLHIVRFYHSIHILHSHLFLFRHLAPQRVHHMIING